MPRPTVDESLATEIRRIHRKTHNGESAGSFQEALDTVVQLALTQANMEGQASRETDSWYPGKYAGIVVDRVIGDSGSSSSRDHTDPRGSTSDRDTPHVPGYSPDTTAVFKARLGDDRTITVPEAEVEALGLGTDEILQVYAYVLDNHSNR